MVLESLIGPIRAEKKPSAMLAFGFLYSTVALFIALWIFREQASLVMVFLTVMASIPIVYNAVKLEEKKDMAIEKESVLLKEHGKAIAFFMFLFIGATLAFAFWYVVLPADIVQSAFSVQSQTILQINGGITGNALVNLSVFSKILFNNLKVLIFCILFAFLYGFGSIFILIWNASVIGVAIGNLIRTNLQSTAQNMHIYAAGNYLSVISFGLVRYAIHGIPEILAYFVGGLAGGIISIAVIRHDIGTQKFEHIVLDSTELIIVSLVLLFVAAFLEVFVTPVLF